MTHSGHVDSVPVIPVPASEHGMPEDATSPMGLRRLLSPLETWGLGATGILFWLFTAPSVQAILGPNSFLVWVPASLVGILINLQVKRMGTLWPEMAGGTPNYTTRILRNYPWLGRYAAIGYFIGWAATLPLSVVLLTDLVARTNETLGFPIPLELLRIGFTLMVFVIAFAGIRSLSVLNLCFLVPSAGLVLALIAWGLGWLIFAPSSPGLLPAHRPGLMTFTDWAKAYYVATWAVYWMETSSSFVADSRRPAATLKCLSTMAWLILPLYVGGGWLLARLATGPEVLGMDNPILNLLAVTTPIWGRIASSMVVTFLIVAGCLLCCANTVAAGPRILYQLARDGHLPPLFASVSRRGVMGPALLMLLFISLSFLLLDNATDMLVISSAPFLCAFIALHLGEWLQRGQPESRWPWCSLLFCALEVVVLVIGGGAWGWGKLLIGLLLPFGILFLGIVPGRLRFGPFLSEWWTRRYSSRRISPLNVSIPFQVIVLLVLILGSSLATVLFSDLFDKGVIQSGGPGAQLYIILLVTIGFLVIAAAAWTSFPQVETLTETSEDLQREVRERRCIESELRMVAEDLGVAEKSAKAASRAKSEFLANMSHEIRTPMNGVLGMLDLTLRCDIDPREREFLGLARSSAETLLRLLNDILDFSKIEAGKLELEKTPFGLRDTFGDAMKTLATEVHKKGLELAYGFAPDVPDALVGDPGRFSQILVNLVGNACKFTERGEIAVRVDLESRAEEGVSLHIAVRDTGIGIAPEKQRHIFAAFTQADGSTTRRYGGTGLGLAISGHLAEAMGGRIWVESQLGQGSTFHFTARFGVHDGEVIRPSPRRLDLAGLPVLVVDDNSTNRKILDELLAHWGMRPTVVDGGRAALAAIHRACDAGEPYPLVLLDAMMPEMDGFAVAAQIHQDPELAGTAVLMLSSADLQSDTKRCRELNIAVYLRKPIKESDLLDSILSVLGVEQVKRAEPSLPRLEALPPGSRRLSILLVEDTPVNQRLAVVLLEDRGHTVVVANDGREALDILDRESFDLILMDVQMPRMDGFQATAAIRAGGGRHEPPHPDLRHDGARDEGGPGAVPGGRDGRLHLQADPGRAIPRGHRGAGPQGRWSGTGGGQCGPTRRRRGGVRPGGGAGADPGQAGAAAEDGRPVPGGLPRATGPDLLGPGRGGRLNARAGGPPDEGVGGQPERPRVVAVAGRLEEIGARASSPAPTSRAPSWKPRLAASGTPWRP